MSSLLFKNAVRGVSRKNRDLDPNDSWDMWASGKSGSGHFDRPLYARCFGCEGITRSEGGVPPTICGYCGRAFPEAGHNYTRSFAMSAPDGRRHRDRRPGG